MERQNRLLTTLAVVLLALVLVVVLDPRPEGEDPLAEDDAPPQSRLFEYEKDDVKAITIVDAAGEVRFEKAELEWRMVRPKDAAVDVTKVTAIVDRFADLKIEDRVLEGEASSYGLGADQRRELRIEKSDGTALSVFLGKDAPVGYRSYASRTAEGGAQLLSSRVGDLLGKGADDFRSRELLDFAATGARRVRVVDGSTELVLRRDDRGWWIGDGGPRADSEKVRAWLSDLSAMKVESFLDGQSPSALGLDTPAASVTVEDDGGSHTLRIGARDASGAAAIAGEVPVRVSATDLDRLLSTSGYVSSVLLDVQTWQVESVELRLGERNLVASRKDGEWTRADGTKLDTVPDLLDAIKAGVVDRSAAPTFAGNWGRIALGLGGDKGEVVSIGDAVAGGRVARDEAGGPAFLVPQDTLDGLLAAVP